MTTILKRSWEIRLEPLDNALSFSFKKKKSKADVAVHKGAVRVRYRLMGKRGRFTEFVLIDGLPKGTNWSDVVDRHARGDFKKKAT